MPLVLKSAALDSDLNPSPATFWLCNTGKATSFLGLCFLICGMGIIIVTAP